MAAVSGLLLASSLALAAAPVPAPDAEATPIAPGMALERGILPLQTHLYGIELREGEYVEVDIEQRGVDVGTTVTGPRGEPVLLADSPGGESGPDPVAFVARSTGLHRLAVTAAPQPWPDARYALRVEAVRSPTAADLLRARALQAGAEGFRLLQEDGPGNAARILELLREALAAWEALGERYLQAWTENQIGYISGELLDRFDAQYEGFSRGLAIAREIHDDFSEAFFLMNVASAARRLGRLDEAESNLERALALHRAAGRRAREAGTLTTFGGFLIAVGRPEEALDRLAEAVRLHHEVGHAPLEARTRLHVGDAYLALGEYELAIESYRSALQGLGDRRRYQALAHRQMGLARFKLGDRAGARSACDQSLALYRTLDNRGEEATASLLLGQLMREDGQLSAARDVFAAAVPVLRAGGDRLGEAQARCELGETDRRLGNLGGARAELEAALALIPEPGLPAALCAEQGLARLDLDVGDLASARRHAERAVDNVESLRASLAGQRWRASAVAARHTAYELLVEARMRQHQAEPSAGHDAAAFAASERARARSLLELLAEGRVDVREGIAPELLAEERSLRQRLNAHAAAQEEALAAKREARAGGLAREIQGITAQLVELEARIRSTSPRYAALTRPSPLDLAAVQSQVLDPETQLLEYALGETGSWLWLVSRERLDSYRLAPRTEIEGAARRVHELASATGSDAFEAAAEELGRLLLAPAASALRARRLLIVAPGALQYVPFAALPLPGPSGRALLSRFEIVTAPSASVVATLRSEGRDPAPRRKVLAVFADPVFDVSDPRVGPVARRGAEAEAARPDALGRALRSATERGVLARLPFSRQEADAIVALAPRGLSLEATGFAASREAATSPRLAEYRFVHFATHGVLNTRQPELSGVVLSLVDPAGRRQDGFLRLHDVYNLRLAADLVVLSGCQTGLGKDLAGEGLVGLTRGFMFAGAPRVVASLWPVDDLATSELMKRFYRGMMSEKLAPAAALRAAQLELARLPRLGRPYYWAGFVLQGEWR